MDAAVIFDKLVSACARTGSFERTQAGDLKSAPGRGLTAAVWVQHMGPAVGAASGLSSTTGSLIFWIRIYSDLIMEPHDKIDPRIISAADGLFRLFVNGFTLDGLIRNVDVRGANSLQPLGADAGYQAIDNKMFRIMTITLPLVVNDMWTEAE